jgi:hypothetical protein
VCVVHALKEAHRQHHPQLLGQLRQTAGGDRRNTEVVMKLAYSSARVRSSTRSSFARLDRLQERTAENTVLVMKLATSSARVTQHQPQLLQGASGQLGQTAGGDSSSMAMQERIAGAYTCRNSCKIAGNNTSGTASCLTAALACFLPMALPSQSIPANIRHASA